MEWDTVVRVVLRMEVIVVHHATSDTTNLLTPVIKTNAVAQTVPVQQAPLAQPTMTTSAVHAIPVTVCRVAHVFRINVPARTVSVQQVHLAQ